MYVCERQSLCIFVDFLGIFPFLMQYWIWWRWFYCGQILFRWFTKVRAPFNASVLKKHIHLITVCLISEYEHLSDKHYLYPKSSMLNIRLSQNPSILLYVSLNCFFRSNVNHFVFPIWQNWICRERLYCQSTAISVASPPSVPQHSFPSGRGRMMSC